MGDLMASLPAVAVRGKRSLVVDLMGGGCTERLPRGSHGVGVRVESCFLRGKEGLVGRRKSRSSASSTFQGIQVPSHSSFDRQTPTLSPIIRRRRAYRKQQAVSPGAAIVAFSDPALHSVLELASDAELSDLSNILYGRSLLSPLLKSFAPGDGSSGEYAGQPPKTQADRDALMVRLEARFLYLAADAKAILSGRRPSYRNVLLQVRRKLQVPCSPNLCTEDMESEIFLHLIQQYTGKLIVPPQTPQKVIKAPSMGGKKRRLGVGVPSLMRLRGKELLSTVLKGGGAVTVSTLQRMVSKMLSGKLLLETARYQLAQEAVVKTGQVAVMLETRVAVLAARQGLIGAAKRYITLRSAMTILGPMLWGTLLADMLISAVGTDYARVVRAIYAFAQIRLVRTYNWDDANHVF